MARSHTRFAPDRGLTSRMVLVMFLLGALYVVFMGVLIVVLNNWVLPILLAVGIGVAQWFFSDKIALFAMRAEEVTPQQAPELHGMVDRLCALADMEKPRIAVSHTDLPNAFATGRNPKKAVLCVTTGIMRKLEPAELEGVISHELSHVAHRDVAVMTIASFLGVLAGIVVRWGMYAGMGRRNNNQNVMLMILAVWAVSLAVYAISFLLTRALSRYRELAADRSAAILTGQPSALASALTKVSGDIARIPSKDLRSVQAASAFFFAPTHVGSSIARLFSTHPTTEKRLAQLAKIARELGQPM